MNTSSYVCLELGDPFDRPTLGAPVTSTLLGSPSTARRAEPARRSRLRAVVSMAEVRWAVAATVLFAVGGAFQLGGAPPAVWWACYLACYATGGWEPALAGLRALRERILDVDLLMTSPLWWLRPSGRCSTGRC